MEKNTPVFCNTDKIYSYCHLCKQIYLKKYWDEDLAWYIQISEHHRCHLARKQKLKFISVPKHGEQVISK